MNKAIADEINQETSTIKILLATLAAFAGAALVLLTLILPAEFNVDPLGAGKVLGIKGLSEAAPQTLNKEQSSFHEDTVSFELLPFEYVEYKYELAQGSTMLYGWTASDMIAYDFHGEARGGPEDFEKSFNLGQDDHVNGAFTAPFGGIHGWFWENRGTSTVTVTLTTAGFYTAALEFRDGDVKKEVLGGD